MTLLSRLIVGAIVITLAGCSSVPTKVDTGPIRARTFNFGVTRVATGGDVTVAYLVILGNNVSTVSINDYFGYRDDAWDLHENAQEAYTGTQNPSSFEAGTLLIDVIDSKGFNVRMRNYATRPTIRNLPADARAARIQEVVDEILRGVSTGP
jgi:hypothetical protein